MRIFQKELYKIYARRKFILVVLLFIGVNAALIFTSTSSPIVSPKDYKKAYTHIGSLPASEQPGYIRDCYYAVSGDNGSTETEVEAAGEYAYFLYQELYGQLEQIEGYTDYLQDIQNRAQNAGNISIFNNKDPFSVQLSTVLIKR